MATINIKPLADRVLAKRLDEAEEQKVGGIIIPDTARKSPKKPRSSPSAPGALKTAGASAWK